MDMIFSSLAMVFPIWALCPITSTTALWIPSKALLVIRPPTLPILPMC